jgi:site-specific DNA-methyltransferase (adenine-specific)
VLDPLSAAYLTLRQKDDQSVDSIVTTPPCQEHADAEYYIREWLRGDITDDFPCPFIWKEAYRVLKPGGYLLAFAPTRSADILSMAIRLGGFQLRDAIAYLREGHKDLAEWEAYLPAWEPIIMARRPLEGTVADNVLKHGVGALNIDASRIASEGGSPSMKRRESARKSGNAPGRPGQYGDTLEDRTSPERYMAARPSEELGRYPANLVHDGSAEVMETFGLFGNRPGTRIEKPSDCATDGNTSFDRMRGNRPARGYADDGSAARFFLQTDREALVAYLTRMVTPDGGKSIDPFDARHRIAVSQT